MLRRDVAEKILSKMKIPVIQQRSLNQLDSADKKVTRIMSRKPIDMKKYVHFKKNPEYRTAEQIKQDMLFAKEAKREAANEIDANKSYKTRDQIDVYQRDLMDVMYDEAQRDDLLMEYAMKLFNNNLQQSTRLVEKLAISSDENYFLKNYKKIASTAENDYVKINADIVMDLIKQMQRSDTDDQEGIRISDTSISELVAKLEKAYKQYLMNQNAQQSTQQSAQQNAQPIVQPTPTNIDADRLNKLQALKHVVDKLQQAGATSPIDDDDIINALTVDQYDAEGLRGSLTRLLSEMAADPAKPPASIDILDKMTMTQQSTASALNLVQQAQAQAAPQSQVVLEDWSDERYADDVAQDLFDKSLDQMTRVDYDNLKKLYEYWHDKFMEVFDDPLKEDRDNFVKNNTNLPRELNIDDYIKGLRKKQGQRVSKSNISIYDAGDIINIDNKEFEKRLKDYKAVQLATIVDQYNAPDPKNPVITVTPTGDKTRNGGFLKRDFVKALREYREMVKDAEIQARVSAKEETMKSIEASDKFVSDEYNKQVRAEEQRRRLEREASEKKEAKKLAKKAANMALTSLAARQAALAQKEAAAQAAAAAQGHASAQPPPQPPQPPPIDPRAQDIINKAMQAVQAPATLQKSGPLVALSEDIEPQYDIIQTLAARNPSITTTKPQYNKTDFAAMNFIEMIDNYKRLGIGDLKELAGYLGIKKNDLDKYDGQKQKELQTIVKQRIDDLVATNGRGLRKKSKTIKKVKKVKNNSKTLRFLM